ncbi:MAG: T9SS type A sorting domain-containing protein, partial [Flavobacteriales bacterium]
NYWSSPVENVTLNTVVNAAFNPANSINNLYIYNPTLPAGSSSQQLLEGWVNVPPSTVMQAARGYITTGVNTVSFTGALHNNNYNFPLQGGSFIRMNLVGNPYPSAISAAEFLNVNGPSGNNRIENTVWFWTDDGSTGGDYAADDYVAFNGLVSVNGVASKRLQFDASGRNINVAQGFVVSATASGVGQNLVFNNTMRRPASGTPFFSTDEVSRFHFTLRNQNNLESEIAVCFREDLTDHFDAHFDSRKMFGNSNIALYTMVNGEPMMIDGYGEHNAHRVIDLGVTAKLAGQHTIEINRIENMDPSVLVFIENIATGEFHNLRNGAFTFNSTGNMTGVHFRLHFREPVTVNAVQESCEQTGGKIEINTPYSGWAYSVRNNEGMVIAMDNNPTAQSIINHVDAGDYTVVLTYTDGYSFEKYVTIEPVVPVNATVEFSATQVSLGAAIIEVMVNSDNATFMSVNMGDGTIYNGMNLVSHAYDQIGTYNVIITVNNEFCTSTYSAVVNVTAPVTTGINNLESNQIAVFPNPAKETANVLINLQSNEGNLTMNITDVNGKVVISRQISSQAGLFNEVIDIRNLDSGVYQISVQGAKFNAVKKLVVAK